MRRFKKFGKLDAIYLKENGKMMPREEWLAHRQLGLGGSDMGTILNMNPRFSAIELFYQKLGLNYSGEDEDNLYMFWGRELESVVLDIAQYFDHQYQEYMENRKEGIMLRKISYLPLMVRNPRYPWLLANLDGLEGWNKSYKYPKADAIAEAKTISKQARSRWSEGIPPYYIAQAVMYGTVMEDILKDGIRANIYILQDGREFSSIPLDMEYDQRLKNLQQQMLSRSYEFWKRIEMGKKVMEEFKGWESSPEMRDYMMQALSEIEPEPDPTPAYEQFYSKFFVEKMEMLQRVIDGDQKALELGLEYLAASKNYKKAEETKKLIANRIKELLKNKNAYAIDFGELGKITFNKRLYVNIKATEGKD